MPFTTNWSNDRKRTLRRVRQTLTRNSPVFALKAGRESDCAHNPDSRILIPVTVIESTLRVYIVEDSPIFLKAIETLLAENERIAIVGYAGEASIAMREIPRLAPEVVILDFQLASGSGIDVLKSIKAQKESSPLTIMFSSTVEPVFRRVSLKLGADFVFEKSRDFDRLAQLLRSMTSSRDTARGLPVFRDTSVDAARTWY
jgi:DNA-binding response OmpR family regulator